MKRANRDVEIFSISALDLFASGMGAFMIIAIILFPYYQNTAVEDMSKKLRQLHGKLEQCNAQGARLRKEVETKKKGSLQADTDLKKCELDTARTYLVIVMTWSSRRHDIDLHIVDPSGKTFKFSRHNRNRRAFPSTNSELSADTTAGPGIEVWEAPQAQPGSYKIYYHFYSRKGNPGSAPTTGKIFYRNGTKQIRNFTLTRLKQKPLIAEIIVKPSGDVEIR
jgi:hypothetical protein